MHIPTNLTFVRRSLRYFYRSHTAVALGIAAATAVIVGALAVGDSVRASLRNLVLRRLANIECVMQSQTFFDPRILEDLSIDNSSAKTKVIAAVILPGSTVESRTAEQRQRASKVQLLAAAESFWPSLDNPLEDTAGHARLSLEEDQVAVNAALAHELSVEVGDEISIRLSSLPGVPADNPLGRRDDRSINLPRQKIVAILPDDGVGGIRFSADQSAPRNVFACLETVQDILESGALVNAALVLNMDSSSAAAARGQNWCDEFNLQLRPALEDYGLQLTRHTRRFPDPAIDPPQEQGEQSEQIIFDYFQLTSKELVIDNPTSTAVIRKIGRDVCMRMITYLANSIAKVMLDSAEIVRNRQTGRYEVETPNAEVPRETDAAKPSVMGEEHQLPSRSGGNSNSPGDTTVPRGNSEPSRMQQIIGREVPYSIIVGIDSSAEFNMSQYTQLPAGDLRGFRYCWVNSWLAEELSLEAGDWLRLKYFEPETVDGQEIELEAQFLVAGVVPLTEPSQPYSRNRPAAYSEAPTIFNDTDLTPTVPGVTDQESISQWDMPFELRDELILAQDDAYWNNHRLTPKLFMPLRYASSYGLFGSRFGQTTSIRFPADLVESEAALRGEIEETLLITRPSKGLQFIAIRQQQLRAASGTTPFDVLFLSLSSFVIVAALLLVTLLLKLGIERRAVQLGLLYAQGFTVGRVRRLLMREHAIVAVLGAALGIVLGIVYARAMIAGLQTWWLGAISTPFLQFSFQASSLLIGFACGLLASLIAIYFGLRKLSRVAPLPLLSGRVDERVPGRRRIQRVSLAVAGFAGFAAFGLMVLGLGQTGMARAGTFFGCGFLILAAALLAIRQWIEVSASYARSSQGGLMTLAWRAITRNPLRSSLALGLLSVASFLIASMGVFQVSPTPLGYGGFNLIAESSQPIFRNIASSVVRHDILGAAADKLRESTVVPMRVRPGEDASCNNLFQVAQPTILGVPARLQDLTEISPEVHEFSWAAASKPQNPWSGLSGLATGDLYSPIPVILDQNTAAWSLRQGQALGDIIQLDFDKRRLCFRTVGLLSNSVLQGKLLISQENFQQQFPDISGYNYFLIRSGNSLAADEVAEVMQVFESGWSDEGLDVMYSQEVLARLLGVQNTYISAFQSLGALGLLLGTFGLVAVQLRSVLERRKELALMRAVGFSSRRIGAMLTLETGILLSLGVLIGILSAIVALAPFVIETGPELSLVGPIFLLLMVLVVGFIASLVAVRAATRQTILHDLRSE